MNYCTWNHRCWLVPYMSTEQELCELKKLRHWAGLNVADYSCFHYRQLLLLRIFEGANPEKENASSKYSIEIHQMWKEELNWDEMLIKRYIGREVPGFSDFFFLCFVFNYTQALWLHRRFLSLIYQNRTSFHEDFSIFVDNEFHLFNSCSTIPDSQFEDYQAQAMYRACYLLWLAKQVQEFCGIEFRAKRRTTNLKSLFSKACPERSVLLDYL